jgi:hypothetical protein
MSLRKELIVSSLTLENPQFAKDLSNLTFE